MVAATLALENLTVLHPFHCLKMGDDAPEKPI
jgi:hypothetical protein